MQRKQHLIALDLDGTLLTNNKTISMRTKDIIFRAIEDGHIVVIATGRPHRASIQYYQSLGLTTPMVNFNGGLIHHPTDKNWSTEHNPITNKLALSIVDACYELNVQNILAEVQDHAYLDQHDEQIINMFQATQSTDIHYPFIVGKIAEQLMDDPTSLLIRPQDEQLEQLQTQLDEHVEFVEHRHWGGPLNIIEITKKGIHKAVGLHKIAAHYQIPQERIIAFGDEDNDLEMIDYAGIGVAMDNAIPPLKSIANHITATNEQDGVGIFLEEYLNLRPIVS